MIDRSWIIKFAICDARYSNVYREANEYFCFAECQKISKRNKRRNVERWLAKEVNVVSTVAGSFDLENSARIMSPVENTLIRGVVKPGSPFTLFSWKSTRTTKRHGRQKIVEEQFEENEARTNRYNLPQRRREIAFVYLIFTRIPFERSLQYANNVINI